MPVKDTEREYRAFEPLSVPNVDPQSTGYVVEGYASTFERYALFEMDGVTYSEQISPRAFDNCDFSDVIMQYNHSGPVYARTRNKTLKVEIDEHGLHIRADLSKTTKSRELYEDIATGLVDRMSFAFTVAEDHWDAETHTRHIDKVKKVYDVSAVSLPANPGTDIGLATRSAYDGYIEADKQEMLAKEARAKKAKMLELKIKLIAGNNK